MYSEILKITCFNLRTLKRAGFAFLSNIILPASIIFEGELGAGKTALIKQMAGFCRLNPDSLTSPTFNIVNQYNGKVKGNKVLLNHFDLYRIDEESELRELPLDLYFEGNYLNCFEWGKKFEHTISRYTLNLYTIDIKMIEYDHFIMREFTLKVKEKS
jgi:tRNA threonylcarbamoyladenosine biosynthesis protein TsaE